MVDWIAQITIHALHVVSAGDIQDLSAVFSIAFLTEFGIPFPFMLDTVLFLLGYQIESAWLKTALVILILMVARQAGSSIVYWLFRSLGSPLLYWLTRRFPSVPRKFENLTARLKIKATLALMVSRLGAELPVAVSGLGLRAPFTIALFRLTPGILSLTSIASGTLRFRYLYFVTGIGMSALFSDCTVVMLGVITGYGLRQITSSPPAWFIIIGIIVNLAVVLFIQYLIWRHSDRKLQPAKGSD
jgi:membrane protein DedA with SNARE-associated domain